MNLTSSMKSSTEDTTLSMKSQVTCLSIPLTDQRMVDLTSNQWVTMEILEVVPFSLKTEKCTLLESNLMVVQPNGIPLTSTLVLEAIIMTGLKLTKTHLINESSLPTVVLAVTAEEMVVVMVEVEMLVVSAHVQTQTLTTDRFLPTLMEMPAMNTPKITQILGVATTTKVTLTQT